MHANCFNCLFQHLFVQRSSFPSFFIALWRNLAHPNHTHRLSRITTTAALLSYCDSDQRTHATASAEVMRRIMLLFFIVRLRTAINLTGCVVLVSQLQRFSLSSFETMRNTSSYCWNSLFMGWKWFHCKLCGFFQISEVNSFFGVNQSQFCPTKKSWLLSHLLWRFFRKRAQHLHIWSFTVPLFFYFECCILHCYQWVAVVLTRAMARFQSTRELLIRVNLKKISICTQVALYCLRSKSVS